MIMKTLLISPRTERSYWNFEEICRRLGRKTMCPPIGLLTVAAMLPTDWELRLVDLNVRDLAETEWEWAELVMIGGMIAQRDSFRHTLQGSSGVIGAHPSSGSHPHI